jgi:hypothetical protein
MITDSPTKPKREGEDKKNPRRNRSQIKALDFRMQTTSSTSTMFLSI